MRSLSLLSILLLIAILFTLACGGGGSNSPDRTPSVQVSITPTSTNLLVKNTTKFVASVTGSSNTAVTYTVLQGSTGGEILNTGDYLAPPQPGAFTVRARSDADPSKFADATVTVRDYQRKFDRAAGLVEGYDYHTASLLADGSVLIVGGWGGASGTVHKQAVRYIPAEDRIIADATLNTAREAHIAATLPSGKVLVAGGWDRRVPGTAFDPVYQTTELYDPAAKTFIAGPEMNFPRRHHSPLY